MIRPTISTVIQRISYQVHLSLKFERASIVGALTQFLNESSGAPNFCLRAISHDVILWLGPIVLLQRGNFLPSHP